MALLKNNLKVRNKLKGEFSTILGELDEIDENDAIDFIKWMGKKCKIYCKALLNKPYPVLPNKMSRGDIVLCDLGINIPPEFSDKNTGKHFVVVWLQQGHNIVVIPITQKKPPYSNKYVIDIGRISGISAETNYARLDSICSVSLRRISRVCGTPNGKLTSTLIREKINSKFLELFVDKY